VNKLKLLLATISSTMADWEKESRDLKATTAIDNDNQAPKSNKTVSPKDFKDTDFFIF
jgi:hypothetical protein